MFDTEIWVALLTLTTLEIVLGVDNLVFISIAVSRLPPERRSTARRFGLALACITRILLLLTLAYLAQMETALFTLWNNELSIRDLVLIAGGLFLLIKGTMEIHEAVEGTEDERAERQVASSFGMVIAQIAVIDIVFSLDSVITAVGMVDNRWVMVAAILIAVIVMLVASDPIGEFIDRHPTIKMLALSFLILVGVALIADGLEFHIPRAYLYFAMAFSAGVEALNMIARRRSKKKAQRRAEHERLEREI
ncbi:MAG TPA: TerC family protein [Candidatus Saccharimonadia bacterium]|nr:TerC family protein [Candidatus Saccharimonadia bacterium]